MTEAEVKRMRFIIMWMRCWLKTQQTQSCNYSVPQKIKWCRIPAEENYRCSTVNWCWRGKEPCIHRWKLFFFYIYSIYIFKATQHRVDETLVRRHIPCRISLILFQSTQVIWAREKARVSTFSRPLLFFKLKVRRLHGGAIYFKVHTSSLG